MAHCCGISEISLRGAANRETANKKNSIFLFKCFYLTPKSECQHPTAMEYLMILYLNLTKIVYCATRVLTSIMHGLEKREHQPRSGESKVLEARNCL